MAIIKNNNGYVVMIVIFIIDNRTKIIIKKY